MHATFERLYRDLGRATAWTLYSALGLLALAVLAALAGLPHAVDGFRAAAAAVGAVFAGLLALFLVSSLVAVVVRYVNRRAAPVA
jgi:hypothetical protein